MHGWLSHHLVGVVAVVIVASGLTLTYVFKRAWLLLLPVPALLAAWAWHGWEFSSEAAPFAIGIAAFGYLGLALGASFRALARSIKRTRTS
jgi:hypothetical protein